MRSRRFRLRRLTNWPPSTALSSDQRVVVGRLLADAPTWPMRSSVCAAPGRSTISSARRRPARPGRGPPRRASPGRRRAGRRQPPRPEGRRRRARDRTSRDRSRPPAMSVARAGSYCDAWKPRDVVAPQCRRARRVGAEGQMAVRVRRRTAPREHRLRVDAGTSRNCRRRFSRSVADALEVGRRPAAGRHDDVGQQAQALAARTARAASATARRRPGPTSVSSSAPMRASASCISMADRSPDPSSSMSAVIAARPGACPPGRRARRRAAAATTLTSGSAATLHRPEREAVVRRVPAGAGKRNAGLRPGHAAAGAVDRAHAITTGSRIGRGQVRLARRHDAERARRRPRRGRPRPPHGCCRRRPAR